MDAFLQDDLRFHTLSFALEADFGYAVHMVDGVMLLPQLFWQFLQLHAVPVVQSTRLLEASGPWAASACAVFSARTGGLLPLKSAKLDMFILQRAVSYPVSIGGRFLLLWWLGGRKALKVKAR